MCIYISIYIYIYIYIYLYIYLYNIPPLHPLLLLHPSPPPAPCQTPPALWCCGCCGATRACLPPPPAARPYFLPSVPSIPCWHGADNLVCLNSDTIGGAQVVNSTTSSQVRCHSATEHRFVSGRLWPHTSAFVYIICVRRMSWGSHYSLAPDHPHKAYIQQSVWPVVLIFTCNDLCFCCMHCLG